MSSSQQFVDCLADRHVVSDEEHTGHGQTGGDSLVGKRRDRLAIMREQHQAVHRRPFEHRRIGRCRQAHIAHVCELKRWIPTCQSVQNVLIEVLIDQKRNQGIKPLVLARAKSSSLPGPGC